MQNEDRRLTEVGGNTGRTVTQHDEHPAIARLRERLASTAQRETPISTYDRMHHRHSRS